MIFGVMMAIKKGKVLFVSKEKSQNLYRQLELQLPQGFYRLGFDNIIRQSQAVVNPWSMPEGFEPRFCAEMVRVEVRARKTFAIPAGLRGVRISVSPCFLARPEGYSRFGCASRLASLRHSRGGLRA